MERNNHIDLSANPFGCYRVYNRSSKTKIKDFFNKVEALLEATRLRKTGVNADVIFMYYYDLFKNFDYSVCGKVPLADLYKDRAQQLRDKYDYLILRYSGGSDSHNILMTFLKNNIKLDAIYVNWPVSALGKGLYKPNNTDFSAKNELSEWDYVIKPDLDWISKHYPEIEIHIDDWLADITREQTITDTHFEKQNHYHSPTSFYRMQWFSDHEKSLWDKGLNVGLIEGADKPNLMVLDHDPNTVSMHFIDWTLQHNVTYTGKGAEYFYWTPDMPLLAIEMAYQNFLYYKHNPQDRWLIEKQYEPSKDSMVDELTIASIKFNRKSDISKKLLYPYWDFNRFQVSKDIKFLNGIHNGKPQDWVFWEHHETQKIQEAWKHHIYSYLDGIDSFFLHHDANGKPTGYKPVFSIPIKIGSYN
jgi:hypothetical protein